VREPAADTPPETSGLGPTGAQTSVEESLAELVRRVDPARWLASRFATAPVRERLDALYAFNHEIARVREVVSDPLVGEIRLAWWREAIDEIYEAAGNVRRHPTVLALAEALSDPAFRPDRAQFHQLIDARERDLDDRAFANIDEVVAYTDATAGGLARIAAHVAAGNEAAGGDAITHAGRAWGLVGLARALPAQGAAGGWSAAPRDAVVATGMTLGQAVRDHDAAALRAMAAPLLDAAEAALREARGGARALHADVWPAIGYVTLARGSIAAQRRADFDPFILTEQEPGIMGRLRMVIASVRGAL